MIHTHCGTIQNHLKEQAEADSYSLKPFLLGFIEQKSRNGKKF